MCLCELEGVFKVDCKSDFMKGAVCQCAQGVGLILVSVLKKQMVGKQRQTDRIGFMELNHNHLTITSVYGTDTCNNALVY